MNNVLTSRKFLIFSTGLSILLALFVLSANINKCINAKTETPRQAVGFNVARCLNKLLVATAEEKYSSELLVNLDRENDFLKKAMAKAGSVRGHLVKEIVGILSLFPNDKKSVFIKKNLVRINGKISQLIGDIKGYLAGEKHAFQIVDWSNSLNESIDELEKITGIISDNISEAVSAAHYMSVAILNCYRQIFLISMYSKGSRVVDDIGRLMFFGYERDITKSWQKTQSLFWFSGRKHEFINKFQHDYFDSFSDFKNNFLKDHNSDTTKLFREFKAISQHYYKFCDDMCVYRSQISRLQQIFDLENISIGLILLLLTLALAGISITKTKEVSQVIKTPDEPDAASVVYKITPIESTETDVTQAVNIYEEVKEMAIDNHMTLNSLYERMLDTLSKAKEKLNAIVYQCNKATELINTSVSRYSQDAISSRLEILSYLPGSLGKAKQGLERFSYNVMEDMAREVDLSSKKLDAISASFSMINKSVESLRLEVDALQLPNPIASAFDKLLQVVPLKMSHVSQWVDEAKSQNESMSNTIRAMNNAVSDVKTTIEYLLGKIESNNCTAINKEAINSNAAFITNTMLAYKENNQESVDSIAKGLATFREDAVLLINSTSSFKEAVLEKISVHDDENEGTTHDDMCELKQDFNKANKIPNRFCRKLGSNYCGKVIDISSVSAGKNAINNIRE